MGPSRGRPIPSLSLSAEERAYPEREVRRHRAPRSFSDRHGIILRCSDGFSTKEVGAELGFHEHMVSNGWRRFQADRVEGLRDEPRPGRPGAISDDRVAAVIEPKLNSTPADAKSQIQALGRALQ